MPLCRQITFLSLSLAKPSVSLMYYFFKTLPVAIQMSMVSLAVSSLLINKLPPRYQAPPRFDCVICFGLHRQERENRMERTNSELSPKGRCCPPLCVLPHSLVCNEGRGPPRPDLASTVPLRWHLGSNAGWDWHVVILFQNIFSISGNLQIRKILQWSRKWGLLQAYRIFLSGMNGLSLI